MTAGQILFSFSGRIDNATFAKYYVGIPFIASLVIGFLGGLLGLADESIIVIYLGFVVLFIWPMLALQAKRWHDCDKSAWWILLTLIPLAGWIWFIELCTKKGTDGDNRFGADPKMADFSRSKSMNPSNSILSSHNVSHTVGPNAFTPQTQKLIEAKQLSDQGLISEEEYLTLKRRILAES